MVSDAAVAHHLVSEDDEAQVVHILYIILLDVYPVLGCHRKDSKKGGRRWRGENKTEQIVSQSRMSTIN